MIIEVTSEKYGATDVQ